MKIPGENGTPIVVTIGKDGFGIVPNDKLPKDEVPGKGTVTEPGARPSQPVDVITPARKPSVIRLDQDPKTGDVTVIPMKPDGSTYPPGTKVEIPGKNGNPIVVEIGQGGKGTVPNNDLPDGNVPGTGKITEPGKPTTEAQVLTPGKINPLAPQTEQPGKIEITRNPNGDAVVTPKKPDGSTYPSGTKVVIPGENGTSIIVTVGDNGSGTVPNDKLPKEAVTGKGIVTEPNKKPSQPVVVTTPARKTPTVELTQDPATGNVTVTPKKPDGTTYPPGTTVEIPGKDGKPIVVPIGNDGTGTVPNNDLPDEDTPGTGRIKEPDKPTVEVKVETPGKIDPTAPETVELGTIEITIKPNGDAVVTPKKTDKTTYPEGTIVKIPGENGTSIVVTIGKDGSGTVPNDQLPKEAKPGKGTVTEPGKKPSNPVDVTTPARKTPTVELDQNPNTGDVTVTPKKPDGTLYPENTKVEIPGKNGKPIVVIIGKDGKGTIPNKDLPDGIEPGKGTITEPGKDPVEVIVTTPARKTPTVVLEPNPQTGVVTVTPDTNGNSGQDTPAPTTPIPDAVTPNANHEDTTDASDSDNGAKSNDSQNVLPNTGTESNATLASLGLLGMLGGLGLALRKKKED
ncbi:hypothetical protein SMIDD26_00857 [Streptococcus mitis]|uniref:Gram-positive cocci surface proteins LPxTG domain-containing protein n=1 Tax=Streptococcus mitis TaxID=28037 RepID=A0A139PT23_STRMT|nr:hypothetical protein SMIDD26_00857 [Streptococcus mitis]